MSQPSPKLAKYADAIADPTGFYWSVCGFIMLEAERQTQICRRVRGCAPTDEQAVIENMLRRVVLHRPEDPNALPFVARKLRVSDGAGGWSYRYLDLLEIGRLLCPDSEDGALERAYGYVEGLVQYAARDVSRAERARARKTARMDPPPREEAPAKPVETLDSARRIRELFSEAEVSVLLADYEGLTQAQNAMKHGMTRDQIQTLLEQLREQLRELFM